MNILVVADAIFPDEEGGMGRMAWEQSSRLQKMGHNIVILTPHKLSLPQEEIKDGIKIFRYKHNPLNPFSSLYNCRKLAKNILRENRFDIIVFHSPFSAFGTILADREHKLPYIYNFHSPWCEEYKIRHRQKVQKNIFYFPVYKMGILLRKIIERKVLQKCRRIIVLSKFMLNKLIRLHRVNPENVSLLFGGVDTERFSPAEDRESVRKELNLPLNRPILLTVRNLLPRMGLENLILAMQGIVKKECNPLLLIAGRGFLEGKLKGLVKKLGLSHYIYFLGFVNDAKLPLYYKAADLFILPTKYLEGFGLVTVEALACGTPVLGTPVGATPEIIEKIDKNLLFQDTAPESIAKLIIEYLKSPDLIRNLRTKCRECVLKNYSWDIYIKKLEEIYDGI